jgi:hypothetical protein
MFNNFLNTYLRCYYFSFVKKKKVSVNNRSSNGWITKGIKSHAGEKKKNFMYYVEAATIMPSNYITKNTVQY